MSLNIAGVKLTIVGDVCEDVLILGSVNRLSRESPGSPIVEVMDRIEVEGCAQVAYRQALALGVQAYLIPVGGPALKSRLLASLDGISREVARWDESWPPVDSRSFRRLLRTAPKADGLLYCQYRPGRPSAAILGAIRSAAPVLMGDLRELDGFVGLLHIVKLSLDDAWALMARPRPRRTSEMALRVALRLAQDYGFQLATITMGSEGYAAATCDGASFLGGALPGGRRPSGAGDIFTATLACALAARHEARDALEIANIAAGLASRKEAHLATVTAGEIDEWTGAL